MMRAIVGSCCLLAAIVGGCAIYPAAPPSLPIKPGPVAPVSRVPLTLKVSWPQLRSLPDSAIPRCAGAYPVCQGTEQSGNFILQREDAWEVIGRIAGKDVGLKGSVWRWDPVLLSLSGQTFNATLHALYHVKVGFTQFGGVAGCGYGEPARELYTNVGGTVSFDPGWFVNAAFTSNVQAGNLCQVTFANVDVTPWIVKAVNGVLKKSTDKAANLVRDRTNVRAKAAELWKKLQEPIELGNRVWLNIRPSAAFAGALSLTDNDQYLSMPVALQAYPYVLVGPKPAPGTIPLPRLQGGNIDPRFNIFLRASVSYEQASLLLTERFVGEEFTLGTSWPLRQMNFVITNVSVAGSGDEVVIAVTVAGSARGTIYLVGRPTFKTSRGENLYGEITFESVDYSVETRNILVHLGNIIFHNRIREKIQAAARWNVSSKLNTAYQQLKSAINRPLTPDARLSGQISKFGPGQLWVSPNGLEAVYPVAGELTVVASPF